ncbi:MAG0110 family membrane protein [Mycoplasma zalophidermidis]|uniref:Bax inhibitor-1/YccA family protein n=1 Tax=Mycoplasma zalophidermidis TaxID=398174 RepID=A0ABS6DRC2_9MOLU|nr:hypothetical protein [Mycoplasma zalophidermidis]MBU4689652.1 hypothetical protein [Mycoplasma zalophidermidis]MBU4693552.1 hypothetical protein [Mycoplasma zalophidermidis]MCR8966489.1 hypothetical protein [Mycoplasma zalophidermidis]
MNTQTNDLKNHIIRNNKIIGGSILSLAFFIIVALAGGILYNYIFDISLQLWVILAGTLLDFALIIIILVFGHKMKAYILGPLASISMFLLGFYGLGYGINQFVSNHELIKLTAIFFIPAASMVLIGALAYFNVLKINKITPIMITLFITIIVLMLVSWFSSHQLIFTIISGVGFLLTLCYMAIDWLIIIKFNNNFKKLTPEQQSVGELIKWSIYFGYRLAFDYIYAFIYLSNFFGK